MPNRQPTYLLWVDLETTGLDYAKDLILEAALILTRFQAPYQEIAADEFIICPPSYDWADALPAVVQDMHVKSGLIDQIINCQNYPESVPDSSYELSDADAEVRILTWLDSYLSAMHPSSEPVSVVIAGSGVAHFDQRVIEAHMPYIAGRLAYYTIDVGILRRTLATTANGARIIEEAENQGLIGASKTHRAMDDIRSHLNEMRLYADRLGAALPA